MPKLKRTASKKAKNKRVKSEMEKFKAGKLHSGSKNGPIVKSKEQAIAISLSESGQSKKRDKISKDKVSRDGVSRDKISRRVK